MQRVQDETQLVDALVSPWHAIWVEMKQVDEPSSDIGAFERPIGIQQGGDSSTGEATWTG